MLQSINLVDQCGIFRIPRPKETLELKMRRLRREYKAERLRRIALNEQAIVAIKVQAKEDDPIQKRIRELELEQAELKASLAPALPEIHAPELPEAPPRHDDSAKIAAGRYLTKHSIRLELAQKRNERQDWAIKGRPFWKVED